MFFARLASPADFDGWREAARTALALGVSPDQMSFVVGDAAPGLFAEPLPAAPSDAHRPTVSKAFPDLAHKLVCHAEEDRFVFAYRLLWRLRTERKLLEIASDPDVLRATAMEKAVRRDSHKMKAFVRFREVEDGEGGRHYIAWFEPFHRVVELTAPFFQRRFAGMVWTILTPERSVHWDGRDHQKPNMGEIRACRWWLDLERELIKPKLIVALGATAAQAVLGKAVTIRDTRSRLIDLDDATKLLVTVHPSYILRLPDKAAQARESEAFDADMAMVLDFLPELKLSA